MDACKRRAKNHDVAGQGKAKGYMVRSTSMNGGKLAVVVRGGVKINSMLFSGYWKQPFRAQSGKPQNA